jgi:hypothetical protein
MYRTPTRKFYLLLLILLLVGCDLKEVERPEHYFRVEVGEDGIPEAVTSAVPLYPDTLLRYVEVVRLRQDESRPETLLYQAHQYRLGSDGHYYVLDRGNGRIAVFGPGGEYLRQFGRRGSGPGEFLYPLLVGFGESSLLVFDSHLRRTTRFALSGEVLAIVTCPASGGRIQEMIPLPDGRLVLTSYHYERYPDGSRHDWYTITVVDADGDTLGSVPSRRTYRPPLFPVEGGGTVGVAQHYGAMGQASYVPGRGILVVHGSEPVIQWFDLTGRPIRRIRLDRPLQPVTETDRDAVFTWLRRRLTEAVNDDERRMIQAEMDHPDFAETRPYYGTVVVDDYGYHWVSPPLDYRDMIPYRPRRVWLLSPEGEYLGDVMLPGGAVSHSGPFLCTVTEDEQSGEPRYIVYRLETAVPGFEYPPSVPNR